MTSVLANKTSPATLRDDIDRAFAHPSLAKLDPSRPTWVKVNGNFNIAYPGSNTSNWFLRAFLDVTRQRGFRLLTVVEGDLPEFKTEDMARTTGLLDTLRPFAVPFLSYERLPRDGRELPRALAEVQLINTPVFHTHGHAVISCATKNLFGLLPVDRRKYHAKLSEKLIELAEWVPCATLVDGTVGLEGESTRRGDPVRCDLLLAGDDVLALDVIAARVMGFDPAEVPLLKLASDLGRVRFEEVVFEGDATPRELTGRRFKLEIGKIRKAAIWLHKLDIDTEPVWAATDPLRVLWHKLNFRRKQRKLRTGAWMEYDSEARDPPA
jgi:uncharacterized protein (DUF362 family)